MLELRLVLTGGGGLGGGAGIAASTINISGISTLGGVKISAGIITAAPGITTVRYFGDGGGLTRLMAEHLLVHRRFGGLLSQFSVLMLTMSWSGPSTLS